MLLSPPEATPLDNFNQTSSKPTMASQMKSLFPIQAAQLPLSPPVSPATKNIVRDESSTHTTTRDPILYPNTEATSASSSQVPLFGEQALATKRVVNEHVAAREPSLFREASPPRHNDYELALEFKSQVMQAFTRSNPRTWFERERAQLLEDQALRTGVRRYPTLAPATIKVRNSGTKIKSAGIVKPPRQPKPKVPRATPEPGKIRVAREDKDFDLLTDYSPPTSSLPNKSNSLKVDWRGAPIDLSYDPHRNLLHPDELLLAANLRLDCATYLTSKRRIFKARIDALKIKKEFRKTDAQQACKIDVNKASKLWQAYEKVGWLNPKWVEQYV
jgi:hypothetical protein